ncbi:MAG: hypothetical protein FWD01_02820, partial [Defluviitaleaceae bacterium]|nr:hypothetical protein [Defluviitaleaceae bacterium]
MEIKANLDALAQKISELESQRMRLSSNMFEISRLINEGAFFPNDLIQTCVEILLNQEESQSEIKARMPSEFENWFFSNISQYIEIELIEEGHREIRRILTKFTEIISHKEQAREYLNQYQETARNLLETFETWKDSGALKTEPYRLFVSCVENPEWDLNDEQHDTLHNSFGSRTMRMLWQKEFFLPQENPEPEQKIISEQESEIEPKIEIEPEEVIKEIDEVIEISEKQAQDEIKPQIKPKEEDNPPPKPDAQLEIADAEIAPGRFVFHVDKINSAFSSKAFIRDYAKKHGNIWSFNPAKEAELHTLLNLCHVKILSNVHIKLLNKDKNDSQIFLDKLIKGGYVSRVIDTEETNKEYFMLSSKGGEVFRKGTSLEMMKAYARRSKPMYSIELTPKLSASAMTSKDFAECAKMAQLHDIAIPIWMQLWNSENNENIEATYFLEFKENPKNNGQILQKAAIICVSLRNVGGSLVGPLISIIIADNIDSAMECWKEWASKRITPRQANKSLSAFHRCVVVLSNPLSNEEFDAALVQASEYDSPGISEVYCTDDDSDLFWNNSGRLLNAWDILGIAAGKLIKEFNEITDTFPDDISEELRISFPMFQNNPAEIFEETDGNENEPELEIEIEDENDSESEGAIIEEPPSEIEKEHIEHIETNEKPIYAQSQQMVISKDEWGENPREMAQILLDEEADPADPEQASRFRILVSGLLRCPRSLDFDEETAAQNPEDIVLNDPVSQALMLTKALSFVQTRPEYREDYARLLLALDSNLDEHDYSGETIIKFFGDGDAENPE